MTSNKKIHFEISERKILLRIFDILFVLIFLCLLSKTFVFEYFQISIENTPKIIVLALYLNLFGAVFEMYNLQVASNQFQVIKSILLTSSTTVLIYLLTPIVSPVLPSNRLQILYFFLAIFLALLLWRIFYVKYLASHRFEKRVLLVTDSEQASELIHSLTTIDPHYKILGFIDIESLEINKTSNINQVALQDIELFVTKNNVSEIVVATQQKSNIKASLYNKLLFLLENGYTIREYTQVFESITQRIPVNFVEKDFYRYFPFSRSNQNQLYLLSVRLFEIIFSVFGIFFTCLLLPFIILINFFANKGSLFYTQERIGKNGESFKILKFRTMIKNAETQGAVFAKVNDTRITPFGKLMRKLRIDEFPQFINVLKGEMSIIGPRPERPVFVQEIASVMPYYHTRHVIKPGLTGWAQVNYSYGDSIEDSIVKLQYDLYYIKHRSIFLDINIIIKTFSTILFYRGQ